MEAKDLLIGRMEDLAEKAVKTGCAASKFLTPAEAQSVTTHFSHRRDVTMTLDGGFAGAERIARYLRIHQLISPLKTRLDKGDIAFIPSVTLSFLKENEQVLLDNCIELNAFAVDMKKADVLRQYSEKGKLDDENIYLILSGEISQKPKPNRTPTVKISKAVFAKYFRSSQSAKEIQDIVEKALEQYFSYK